jgi:hypothetical protein
VSIQQGKRTKGNVTGFAFDLWVPRVVVLIESIFVLEPNITNCTRRVVRRYLVVTGYVLSVDLYTITDVAGYWAMSCDHVSLYRSIIHETDITTRAFWVHGSITVVLHQRTCSDICPVADAACMWSLWIQGRPTLLGWDTCWGQGWGKGWGSRKVCFMNLLLMKNEDRFTLAYTPTNCAEV